MTTNLSLGDSLQHLTVYVTPGAIFAGAITKGPGPDLEVVELRFGTDTVDDPTDTWAASVTGDAATFAISGTRTEVRAENETVVLWVNGLPRAAGTVRLRRV